MTPHHTDLDVLLEAMLGDEPECDCGRPNGDASHEPVCSWVAYMRGQIWLEHAAPALAQALLRARKALEVWSASAYVCLAATCKCESGFHLKQLNAGMVKQTREALDDTELLEAMT